jgi:hypothetical protein
MIHLKLKIKLNYFYHLFTLILSFINFLRYLANFDSKTISAFKTLHERDYSIFISFYYSIYFSDFKFLVL